MQKKSLTVVIITRNRSADLVDCLRSLSQQSSIPEEILIINNGSTDNTRSCVASFKKATKKSLIRVIDESRIGYSFARNKSLAEVRSEWLAFIDDDCIASRNWLENLQTAIEKNKTRVHAIIGQTRTYYPKNIYAHTTHLIQQIWKKKCIVGEFVKDFEILDTKNIALNTLFLKKNSISFDEKFTALHDGASEDCDLGMQIQRAGGKAIFKKNAIVFHKDPITFLQYWKKLIKATKAHINYEKKWFIFRYKIKHSSLNSEWMNFTKFFLKRKKTKVFLCKQFILLVFSFLIVKFIKLTHGQSRIATFVPRLRI